MTPQEQAKKAFEEFVGDVFIAKRYVDVSSIRIALTGLLEFMDPTFRGAGMQLEDFNVLSDAQADMVRNIISTRLREMFLDNGQPPMPMHRVFKEWKET